MLAANEAVAGQLKKLAIPTIYRVHENPDPDKLAEYREFVLSFNYRVGDLTHRAELQRLLAAIRGKAEEQALKVALLKSLKRARYAPQPAAASPVRNTLIMLIVSLPKLARGCPHGDGKGVKSHARTKLTMSVPYPGVPTSGVSAFMPGSADGKLLPLIRSYGKMSGSSRFIRATLRPAQFWATWRWKI